MSSSLNGDSPRATPGDPRTRASYAPPCSPLPSSRGSQGGSLRLTGRRRPGTPHPGFVGRYDEIRLVPFGEHVPFGVAAETLKRWADFVSEFEPGFRSVVFEGRPARFALVIGYEGISPDSRGEPKRRR